MVGVHERGLAGVRSIAAAAPAGSQADSNAQRDAQLQERSEAVASYARLQADIADVVARLDPPRPNGGELAAQADQALVALMPQPVVVLPLPPTDKDMIELRGPGRAVGGEPGGDGAGCAGACLARPGRCRSPLEKAFTPIV